MPAGTLFDGREAYALCARRAQYRGSVKYLGADASEGIAYHLDTRLRPHGTTGALALPVDKFAEYLMERAERWERLAWTRYRVLTGSPALSDEMNRLVAGFVYGDRDTTLPAYARHIRWRMETELGRERGGHRFDLKVGRGGLADIDFLLQLLQIHHGATRAEWRVAGSRRLLAALPESPLLDAHDAARLRDAHLFLWTLETRLRIESETGASVLSTDPDSGHPDASTGPSRERVATALRGGHRRRATNLRAGDCVVGGNREGVKHQPLRLRASGHGL